MSEILILQHEPDVHPGRLAELMPGARVVRLWEDATAIDPLTAGFAPLPSGLVVLGGRADAYADDRWPWLPGVRALLRQCIAADVPVLGICLGHQLLAVATGGSVEVGAAAGPEYGVTPLTWEAGAETDPLTAWIGGTTRVFEDHGDAVSDVPPGARVLARSDHYVQVMRVGSAVGVQFHPEVTRELAAAWQEENTVTDTAEILRGYDAAAGELADTCARLVGWLMAEVEARA